MIAPPYVSMLAVALSLGCGCQSLPTCPLSRNFGSDVERAGTTFKEVTSDGVNIISRKREFVLRYKTTDPAVNDESVEKILEEIGKKLKELRKTKGYSGADSFAYDHDLPRVHYWRMEKGKANITIKSLLKILTIHNMTVEEFFREIK